MKATLDRKELFHNIKLLSGLSEKGDILSDKISMVVDDNQLVLLAGARTNVVVIRQDLLEEGEGSCCTSFALLNILKMIRDDRITLKAEKKLSLKGDKGFRGTMSLIEETIGIYDKVKEWQTKLSHECITLDAKELTNLSKGSLEFPAFKESRWIDINMDENGIFGSIQPNEIGSIDHFPLTHVDGNIVGVGVLLTFKPDQLISQLSFCGERVRISMGQTERIPACFTDPDNDSWFSLLSEFKKPMGINDQPNIEQ